MPRLFALIIAGIFLIVLTSCASPYQREGFGGGYSDAQLSENVFRVGFRGNGYTSADRASDFALIRAAELTLENGFNYFVVVNENNSVHASSYTTPTTTNSSAYVSGNYVYGNSTTYGGQTFTSYKPRNSVTIACFKNKPEQFSFDAGYLIHSLKTKYGLEDYPAQTVVPAREAESSNDSYRSNSNYSPATTPITRMDAITQPTEAGNNGFYDQKKSVSGRRECLWQFTMSNGAEQIREKNDQGIDAKYLTGAEVNEWLNSLNEEKLESLADECVARKETPKLNAALTKFINARSKK
jgi:hypothetical protein